jgi:filamentous hemagglutinin
MKALSDAQDAQLKTCTTSESCKGIATGEFNPLQQSYMGLFNSSTTDLLNFCNAGDTACSATLNYIAQHSNVAMIASNDAGADSLAGANALLAATVAMAKSFQAQDPELDAAKAYAKALLITASPGFAAALGSTVGSYSASATNALNLAKTLASQQQLSDMAAGKFSVIAGSGSNTILTDAPRLVAEYGGSLGDWSKISSSAFTASDGTKVEVHAYRNALTGAVVEPKSIQN